MRLTLMIVAFAIPALPIAAPAFAQSPQCSFAGADKQWVESSLAAWRQVSVDRLQLPAHAEPTIVVFDEHCRFERGRGAREWTAEPHSGSVRIPDGNVVPAQVTSFAGQDMKSGTPFFVMALPPVWAAAKIPISGDLKGLTGVFLHEFSHTRQIAPLKIHFDAAERVKKMSDDFSDDSLQKHFRKDPVYVAVIERESALLYEAAAEPDEAKARALAARALALMEARQQRWFVGEEAYWKNYDDLFLTMEGFGQWVAFAWLADASGGAIGRAAAIKKMRGGGGWWSQEEGLALFLVIDRFVPDWPKRAFAERPALGIDLLRLAATPHK